MSRVLWRSLQLGLVAIGWPLMFAGSWLIEAADCCNERVRTS